MSAPPEQLLQATLQPVQVPLDRYWPMLEQARQLLAAMPLQREQLMWQEVQAPAAFLAWPMGQLRSKMLQALETRVWRLVQAMQLDAEVMQATQPEQAPQVVPERKAPTRQREQVLAAAEVQLAQSMLQAVHMLVAGTW